MRRYLPAVAVGVLFFVVASASYARHHRHHHHRYVPQQQMNCMFFCNTGMLQPMVPTRIGAVSTSGLDSTLAAKVAEIENACGSIVISGVRHTLIAGTRHLSLHASGKAVDMRGNPRCIYSHLAGWPGGYSIDYGRMRHIHISYDPSGGREMGIHFRHGVHFAHHHRHHRHHLV